MLNTPKEFMGKEDEYVSYLEHNSMRTGAGIMYAYAEADQTCSNACASKLDPSLKETAREEYAKSQYAPDINESNAKLEDLCLCGAAPGDSVSFKDNGIDVKNMDQYEFDNWKQWDHQYGLDLNGSSAVLGIPEGNKSTCSAACDTLRGKPTAAKDEDDAGALEPYYIGFPQQTLADAFEQDW